MQKKRELLSSLCLVSTAVVILAQPGWAKSMTETTTTVATPSTKLAQAGEIISVTGVKLTATDNGFEVILETKQPDRLKPNARNEGKSFIIEIPNSQLKLSSGNIFRQEKPFAGIAEVSVIEQPGNIIQLKIIGESGVPKAELFDGEEGLVFGITPVVSQQQNPTLNQTQNTQTQNTPTQNTQNPESKPETEQQQNPTTQRQNQNPESQPESEPIELTVTAEKFEENVKDVPISITVIPKQQLEDSQINTIEGIARNTPNFIFLPNSSRNFSLYSIRGLGNNNVVNRDSVGFYIDDVPYDNGAFLDLNLADLERVEVLRGPQSTLYGRNTQSGVVNIISRQPTNSPEIRGAASYGNYNNLNLQLSLSDAIIPDKILFRLSGAYARREGFFENTFLNENVGDQSSGTVRGQFLWKPSQDWTVSLIGSYTGLNNDGDIIIPLSQQDSYKTTNDHIGFSQSNSDSQALKIIHDNAGFTLTSITARRYSQNNSSTDADGTSNDLFRVFGESNSTIWSQEIRLQSPNPDGKFRWLFGGYYESRDFKDSGGLQLSDAGAAIFGLPSAGSNISPAELSQTTYAAFGQVDYRPIDPLTLTLGLRYESSSSRMDRRRIFQDVSGFSLPLGDPFNNIKTSDDIVIPRFALQYRFNPNLTAYGSITRGYKPSGLNYRTDSQNDLIFKQETSWNYELGLKSSWFDDRLAVNLAGFIHKVDDYQVSVFSDSLLSNTITNAGVDIHGLELEVRATPVKGLDLVAGLGYTNAEFSNFQAGGVNYNGNKLPYVPDFTYNLAAQYRSPGGFLGRVELLGLGSYTFDEANKFKQKSFALVNTRVGYEGKKYGVYLFANNIFDTKYLTNALEFGQAFGYYGDRATYGVQVKVNF
ncbi:MAG: TonB-dependent receptor [Scytonematopsis contorta HA4267-MV1]|jgi:iron complex outermembrane receptor protein|nr:TonB-dependent receptor [Scytonematopsis contorta HA4267-MV1]